MKTISVISVDDSDADRYIIRRELDRAEGFEQLGEQVSGDDFLDAFYQPPLPVMSTRPPTLILMDVRMPGRDGFETIEAMQERMRLGDGPDDILVVMCTSSEHPRDLERAANMPAVKGYLTKPFDRNSVSRLREIVQDCAAA